MDGALFYFRNEKQGVGPCAVSAGCPLDCTGQWPGPSCLAGRCAEPTAANLPAEVVDVRKALPPNASLHVGLYVTGAVQPSNHPGYDCSTPSAQYARLVLEASLSQPAVDGVVTAADIRATGETIAELQLPSGQIPWFPGGHCDPFDHRPTPFATLS